MHTFTNNQQCVDAQQQQKMTKKCPQQAQHFEDVQQFAVAGRGQQDDVDQGGDHQQPVHDIPGRAAVALAPIEQAQFNSKMIT